LGRGDWFLALAGILIGPLQLFGHNRVPLALLILDELLAKANETPVPGFRQGAYTAVYMISIHKSPKIKIWM
jgi:hypothetical protein